MRWTKGRHPRSCLIDPRFLPIHPPNGVRQDVRKRVLLVFAIAHGAGSNQGAHGPCSAPSRMSDSGFAREYGHARTGRSVRTLLQSRVSPG